MPDPIVIDPTSLTDDTRKILTDIINQRNQANDGMIWIQPGDRFVLAKCTYKVSHELIQRRHNEGRKKDCFCFEVLSSQATPVGEGANAEILPSLGVLSVWLDTCEFKTKPGKRVLKKQRADRSNALGRAQLVQMQLEGKASKTNSALKAKLPTFFQPSATSLEIVSFLTMRHLPGDTLKAYIRGHQREHWDDAPDPKPDPKPTVADSCAQERIQIAIQLFTALDAAHQANIVHLDIRPSNMMLHDGKVTLIDYGFAGEIGSGCIQRFGTPHFMAPEILLERTSFTRQKEQDVYSAGVTLAELFDATITFPQTVTPRYLKDLTEDPRAIDNLLHHTRFVADDHQNHVLASLLKQLINQLCAKAPKDRIALSEAIRQLDIMWTFLNEPSPAHFKHVQGLLLNPDDDTAAAGPADDVSRPTPG